jgi:ABC-type branched-subunit amino acid transport system substrate-binding protein
MKFNNAFITLIIASLFAPFLAPNYANAQNEAGISKTEIFLGATFPQTGPLSPYFQDFFIGAQAYFDYLNSKGGIQGRKIRLITRDDKGLATIAVTQGSALILADKVFALFNSAPFVAGHVPMLRSIAIDRRKVPNLAVTASFSGLTESSKYQTTFQAKPNAKQDIKVLTHFIEQSFSSTPINVSYPDDDIGRDFEQVMTSSSRKYSKVGSSMLGCGGIPFAQKDFGVLSLWGWFCGERQGAQKPVLVTSDSFPLIVLGSSISSSSGAYIVASSKSNNVYANFSLPLYTDTQDPFIQFFTQVFKEFAPNRDYSLEIQINDGSKSAFNYVSQQMYEGANAAYVISQAIAALGPEPTRASLIAFLRSNSKSLSSATFSPIDYSLSSNIGDTVQYIARYDGSKWVKVSDYYLVNASGTSIKVTAPQRSSLLPGGLPVATVTEKSLVKIKCVKGKVTKQVTGRNPKCPTGYKKLN